MWEYKLLLELKDILIKAVGLLKRSKKEVKNNTRKSTGGNGKKQHRHHKNNIKSSNTPKNIWHRTGRAAGSGHGHYGLLKEKIVMKIP
jgi:type III secretory pathway component EscU